MSRGPAAVVRRTRALLVRLIDPLRRHRRDRDLDAELQSHLELQVEAHVRAGMPRTEARRRAVMDLGGVEVVKERYRERRGLPLLDAFGSEVRHAVRLARRNPGFSAVAMVTLALGIGSVTVIYSVVRNVVLDPFPYAHSDRMVDVLVRSADNRILRGALPADEFLDYQEQSQAFEDVVGTIVVPMYSTSEAGAERFSVAWVTPNAFSFLGVGPMVGRVFEPGDAAPDAPRVAVLNHRSWTTKFGGDRSVVGRTIVLDGEARTIIGIMPPRFEWNVADLWIPGALSRTDSRDEERSWRWFQARLRPGVSVAEARARVAVVAARRAALLPEDYPHQYQIQVITVIDWVVGRFRRVLYTLFAAVGLLLVIACCNVANMLLARASAREREMSVRAALGAGRTRIVRQLLAESGVLALGGTAGGCLMAYGGIAALALLMPRQNVPWETELRLDLPVLLFALGTAVVATLAFGLFPALRSARRELLAGTGSTRGGTANRRDTRMRAVLVVAQVALSIVLLLGAGVLMRSFVALVGVDLGFDTRNMLVAGVSFAGSRTAADPALAAGRHAVLREALRRVASIPGVRTAALTSGFPPFGSTQSPIEAPSHATTELRSAIVRFCSEDLIAAFGLRLVAGRSLTAAEVDGGRKVAVVNRTLAHRVFGTSNPLGQTIRLTRLASMRPAVAEPSFEIVGIVEDYANQGIRDAPLSEALVPFTFRRPDGLLTIRTSSDPMLVVNALRRELAAVDPRLALAEPMSLELLLQRNLYAQPRFSVVVLGMFAGSGLLLVALGVYGVMAYTVAQKTREMAIRLALGGQRRDVFRLVLRLGARLLAAGVAIGVVAGAATNRLLVNQLWNTSPHDVTTVVAAVTLVALIGLLACGVPARRAMRVDPMVALREE